MRAEDLLPWSNLVQNGGAGFRYKPGCHHTMPLLDNGLVAVAVTPPECESFVKNSYRVLQELSESTTGELQEHCTHAVDHRKEANPGSVGWGESGDFDGGAL